MDQSFKPHSSASFMGIRPHRGPGSEAESDFREMEVRQDQCDVTRLICQARGHFKTVRRLITAAYWFALLVVAVLFLIFIKFVWYFLSR